MDDPRELGRKRRRVPPDLRRRALVSCDRCKKRRVKCLRQDGQQDQSSACKNCIDSNSKCETTLPRKQRVYTSLEKLNSRYRVLDALVKGLYPDRNTEDISTLYSIGLDNNIDIPQLNENAAGEEKSVHAAESRSVAGPSLPVFTPPLSTDGAEPGSAIDVRQKKSVEELLVTNGGRKSNPFVIELEKLPEEKLIPSPHGPAHYIGPSSSFSFVITVRSLVAKVMAASKTISSDDERTQLGSDFAVLKMSKALEPSSPNGRDSAPGEAVDPSPERVVDGRDERQKKREIHQDARPPPNEPFTGGRGTDPIYTVLPARQIADSLLNAFFDRVHPDYLLFDRSTFQLRYEQILADDRKPLHTINPGWMCCLFMMFVFGAQILQHHDHQQSLLIQRHYLDLIHTRLDVLITTTDLTNVQALLLLALHQHHHSERNNAWMLVGCSSRMAMSLGMHRESTTREFDSIEREVRRRVWWTLYMFEKNLGIILGRPSAIDDLEINVSIPNDTFLDGSVLPPEYIKYAVQLTKLSTEVKQRIYILPANDPRAPTTPQTNIAEEVLLDLENWSRNLPPYLRVENLSPVPKHRRAVLLLHIQFYHLQILVTRPFLLRKVELQVAWGLENTGNRLDMDPKQAALSYAAGSYAKQLIVLLHQLVKCGAFNGVTWLDIYYFFHSVIILSADFLGRRGQADSEEDLARKEVVREIVNAVPNTNLSPTFRILTQVALQFAKIVGIFEDNKHEKNDDRRWNPHAIHHEETTTPMELKPQGDFEDIVNHVFQNDELGDPWDFLGYDAYGGFGNNSLYNMPIPVPGTFSSLMARDDFNTGSMNLMGDHTSTHWTSIPESSARPHLVTTTGHIENT